METNRIQTTIKERILKIASYKVEVDSFEQIPTNYFQTLAIRKFNFTATVRENLTVSRQGQLPISIPDAFDEIMSLVQQKVPWVK